MKKLNQYLDGKIKDQILKQNIIVSIRAASLLVILWGGFAVYYQTLLFINNQESLIWYLLKTTISVIFILGGAYEIYCSIPDFIQALKRLIKTLFNQ